MFKLALLFAVVAVAAARPGLLSAPALALAPAIETRTAIIGEKTIESHGNSIVHASAPVITSYAAAAPAIVGYAAAAPAIPTAILAEKTIEAHGNSIVHASAPAFTSYAAPAAPLFYAAPTLQKTIIHGGHHYF